ncbi:MAG TPA: class I SAM-dependent methyltransferase [Thermodesulfobacteriota bacterium]|nr:class I SAM-dependent methyltransferase [Thermodesulfobacteriota bacterium]
MTKEVNETNITPQKIIEDLWMARASQALVAGIELDLFTHIYAGKKTAKDIARAANASEHSMVRLLDTLVGIGYLRKNGNSYRLKPVSEKFLVQGKDSYMGGFAHETRLTWDDWSRLTDVVKSGRPVETVDSEQGGREFFPKLVSAIFPMSFGAARAAVAALHEKTRRQIKNILDVAAGSGAWSLAFAEAIPDARVMAVDYPEVTPITRQFTERLGVADRYNYIEGNLREIDFGRNRYDLVILGHIIHSEGEKWGKRLIKKSYRVLKDGGLLLIAEIIPNDARTGPRIPLLFGLNMLLHTEQGDVFTMREYREWLKEAGFKKVRTIETLSPSPLILATK